MGFGALADLVVVAHFVFLIFVVGGALWVRRCPTVAWFHIPAAAWGASSITVGLPCPLTALEGRLRRAAGERRDGGGFGDRYIEDVLIPDELTRVLWAAAAVLLVVCYAPVIRGEHGGGGSAPTRLAPRRTKGAQAAGRPPSCGASCFSEASPIVVRRPTCPEECRARRSGRSAAPHPRPGNTPSE
jgi:hypothetical protein